MDEPTTNVAPLEASATVVPETMMEDPGERVWVPMTKADEGFAVTVDEPMVATMGVVDAGPGEVVDVPGAGAAAMEVVEVPGSATTVVEDVPGLAAVFVDEVPGSATTGVEVPGSAPTEEDKVPGSTEVVEDVEATVEVELVLGSVVTEVEAGAGVTDVGEEPAYHQNQYCLSAKTT